MATDVYELKIWWADADGKKSANITHWQSATVTGGGFPYDIANELITAFAAANQAALLDCVASDVTLAVYQCRRVTNGGGPTAEQIINSPGTFADTSFSNAAAANIALIPSTAPYKRKTGHFFLGGVPSTAIVGDVWQAAYETVVQAFIALLQIPLTVGADHFNQVIYDRVTAIATGISDWLFRNVISPLRRRLKPRF
jgi:hypothetical protein